MNRRNFSRTAGFLGLLPLLGGTGLAQAQARAVPKAGKDYIEIDRRAPVEAPAGRVEVIEFFWYNCPHCYAFEPLLEPWAKKLPPYVAFRRVPVVFQKSFEPQQRLYYTLEAMGKVDEYQPKVFDAIHKGRQNLDTDAAILAWAEKNGLDKAKFAELSKSFSVATKLQRAKQLQEAYQVAGVPALGVAGRYYVDGDTAGSMERALQVTDYLVGQEHKG